MEISNTPAYVAGQGNGSGYGGFPYEWFLSQQLCEIRRDTGEVESNIRETLHTQALAQAAEFCAVNKNVSDTSRTNLEAILENRAVIKDVQCDIGKSVLENRVALMDTKAAIFEKVDRETDLIKLQLNNFERNTEKNFCKIEGDIKDGNRLILDRLSADKLDEKNEIIDRLRHKNERHEQDFFIGNRLNSIEALVNSVKQDQQFTSKTVQFGSYNDAKTKQTANQA